MPSPVCGRLRDCCGQSRAQCPVSPHLRHTLSDDGAALRGAIDGLGPKIGPGGLLDGAGRLPGNFPFDGPLLPLLLPFPFLPPLPRLPFLLRD